MKEKFKNLLQREFNANETLLWLKSPIQIYWCWAVTKIYKVDEVGLILKVDGHLHKDFVLITLGWNDTYIVTLLDKEFNIIKTQSEVYVDVLQDTVDGMIETKSDY